MEYESAIVACEGQRSKGPFGLFGSVSALIIQITPDAAHPLEAEMRHVNYHFLNWLARRGNKCADLVLEFTAPMSTRPAIEVQVSRLLLQDCQFNEIIHRLDTEFTIQDPHTGETYMLGASIQKDAGLAVAHPPPLPDNAPQEKTLLCLRGQPTPGQDAMVFLDDDAGIAAAIVEARNRIPEFKAMLDSRQAGVTVHVPWECGDIHDIIEASLVGQKGDELEVEFTPAYAPGPVRKTYRFNEILDWTVYHENGQQSGGFTTRASQRSQERGQSSPGEHLKS